MRGSLLISAREYLIANHKPEVWSAVMTAAGFAPTKMFMALETVGDDQFIKLVEALAKELNSSMQQTWDLVADHWINVYTPRTSPYYFSAAKSAREFLLKMHSVHQTIEGASKGSAKPPAFTYAEHPDGSLSITYLSARQLLGYFTALIKAVGKHYNEQITVTMENKNTANVRFG